MLKRNKFFVPIIVLLLSSVMVISASANNWGVGNRVYLCKDAEIRQGSDLDYPAQWHVPEDGWEVEVIDGPRHADGYTWWDISRAAVGDPNGGTGWIIQSQNENCSTGGNGGSGGSGDGGGSDPEPLELIDFQFSSPSVEMRKEFILYITIKNPASVDQEGHVSVESYGAKTDKGDSNFSHSFTALVPANQTHTFEVGPIQHAWIWFGDEEVPNCGDAYGFFETLVASGFYEFLGVSDITDAGSAAKHAIRGIFGIPDNEYEYHVRLNDSDTKVSTLRVDVPGWKMFDFWASFGYDLLWGGWSASAIVAEGSGLQPMSQLMMESQVMYYQGACEMLKSALDPDPNYAEMALPAPIIVPEHIASKEDSTAKELVLAIMQLQSDMYAMNTSFGRYEGAKLDGETHWMSFQLTAARKYTNDVLYDLYRIQQISEKLEEYLTLSNAEIDMVYNEVVTNGLPAYEIDKLRADGYSNQDIQRFTDMFIFMLEHDLPGWNNGISTLPLLQGLHAEKVKYSATQLADISGEPLDITPPTSSISISANYGNNNWMTSYPIISLSATDNSGGSGVARIEYSFDNGYTWETYSGPFTYTVEGEHHLIVRATDNEGNMEFPPAEVDFKVDVTPPVVETWTDQEGYTRVEPFVVHFSGFDPVPGSGLYSLIANFDNQSVSDSQVIDMFWYELGTYTLEATGEDHAGWITVDSSTIEFIATLDSLDATITHLCEEGHIKDPGTCKSLSKKTGNAIKAMDKGNNNAAYNIVEAMRKEIEALTDKHISVEAQFLLMMDTEYILNNIEK